MTVIVDYGCGNLFSLKSSLRSLGIESTVSGDPQVLKNADRLILPGVGAFADAAKKLSGSGLDALIRELSGNGKPLLGICLGMQLLFDRSFEYGETEGLGLIKGNIRTIETIIPIGYKVPHIGWNSLNLTDRGRVSPLFKYTKEGDFVYFVHSYAAMDCGDSLLATAEYGGELTAAVGARKVYGVQFHPEKSGETGLRILKAFCEIQESL